MAIKGRGRGRKGLALAIFGALALGGALAFAENGLEGYGAKVSLVGSGGKITAAGAMVDITGEADEVAASGALLSLKATVGRDVWAAGADVSIDGTVGRDVVAAGARIQLRGRVGRDMWLAGGVIDAELIAGGDIRAGGARVSLGPTSDVQGTAALAGAEVTFTGHVAGRVRLAGARITFNGRADGDLTIDGAEVNIGPNALIGGNLIFIGATTATIDPGAKINGAQVHQAREGWWRNPGVQPGTGMFWFALFIAGTAILAGLGLIIFARGAFDDAADRVQARPFWGIGGGILALVAIPLLAGLVALTGVGIPLAIGLLMLMPFLFIIGHATAALGIADWVLNRSGLPRHFWRTLGLLALGAIVIALVGLIPVVGGALVFVALILGIGSFLGALSARLRGAAPART
ncbi:MAG TPA: hypothetical protein VFB16_00490 [Bauldia sp.]|nr:hypothetical protein [Bauldia sp.]